MLILARKVGERIIIADNIVLTLLEVQGRRARLGIEAPPDVNIRRQELAPHDQEAGAETAPTTVEVKEV